MDDKFNHLAHLLKQGDHRAGEQIFDNFSRPIYRYFLVKTMSKETAEDLTQDVFVKVIDKIESFNETLGSFSGWIWQVAKNTVKDYYRKKKTIPLSDYALIEKERENFLSGTKDAGNNLKMSEVSELIKDFNEDEQEVFSLHYLSDLPYRDISKVLGKSESSLRVLVHRINKKIRRIINGINPQSRVLDSKNV